MALMPACSSGSSSSKGVLISRLSSDVRIRHQGSSSPAVSLHVHLHTKTCLEDDQPHSTLLLMHYAVQVMYRFYRYHPRPRPHAALAGAAPCQKQQGDRSHYDKAGIKQDSRAKQALLGGGYT
jgi:hypothetical protein